MSGSASATTVASGPAATATAASKQQADGTATAAAAAAGVASVPKEGAADASPASAQTEEINIDQLSSTNVFAFGLQSYGGFGNEGENGASGSAPPAAGSVTAGTPDWQSSGSAAVSDGSSTGGVATGDLPAGGDALTMQTTSSLEQLVLNDGSAGGINMPNEMAGPAGPIANFQHPNGVDPYMYLNNINMQGGMPPQLSAHAAYMSLPNNIVPNVNFLGGSAHHGHGHGPHAPHAQNGPFGQQQQAAMGMQNGYPMHGGRNGGGLNQQGGMPLGNVGVNPSMCKFYAQGHCARGEQCNYAHMTPTKGQHMAMMMHQQQQQHGGQPRQPRQHRGGEMYAQPKGERGYAGHNGPRQGRGQGQMRGNKYGQGHHGQRMNMQAYGGGYGGQQRGHRMHAQQQAAQHQHHINNMTAMQQGQYDPMMQMGGMGGENPQMGGMIGLSGDPMLKNGGAPNFDPAAAANGVNGGSLLNTIGNTGGMVPADPMNMGLGMHGFHGGMQVQGMSPINMAAMHGQHAPMHGMMPPMHVGLDGNMAHAHAPHGHDRDPYELQGGVAYASSPMSDFLSKFTAQSSPEELTGHIYLIAKDQYGCRLLQRMLDEQKAHICDLTFTEVFDHMNELMTDPFGNYLCQKLIEHCNENQRFAIIQKVAPDLVAISLNMHGTRAVQKLVETISTPKEVELVIGALRASVVTLIKDLNGNHVIQRCLHHLNSKDNQFIYDAVSRHCVSVATHKHGCCVLQRTIDYATITQKRQLVQEIVANALELVQDAFGNYVVQYILDLGEAPIAHGIMQNLLGNISSLSVQKFSSNVVEKCLELSNDKMRVKLIDELVNPERLPRLLNDQYANYVIQKALGVSKKQQFERLVAVIKPHLIALRNTSFGKRIQSKILKKFPDLNISFDVIGEAAPDMSPIVINAIGLDRPIGGKRTAGNAAGATNGTAATQSPTDEDGLDAVNGAPGGMSVAVGAGLNALSPDIADPMLYLAADQPQEATPAGEETRAAEETDAASEPAAETQ